MNREVEEVFCCLASGGNKLAFSMKRAMLELAYIRPHVVSGWVEEVLSCMAAWATSLQPA